MRVPFRKPLSKDERRSFWSRFGTLLIVLLVHIFGVIGLIMLAPEYIHLPKKPPDFTLLTLAEPRAAQKEVKKTTTTAPAKKAAAPPTPPTTALPPPPLQMLVMDHQSFASSDISKMPSAAPSAVAADSGTPGGKGEGPNGEKLYNAEWYREPTEAETGPYFRNVHMSGWGEIACRTIDHWHVEDCRELDESPAGAGIARAARQAAWQFLVRPPRVGGKMLIGSWVRIRYTLTMRGSDPGPQQ